MTLAKIKVLDFTHLLPGEVASTLLSDMGAQILRIEKLQKGLNESLPPIVDGESLYFWALHRNKKRIRLDLKKQSAIELIKKLVKDADVVLENFRPGVMERLGLDYETLKAINPAIVYCSISGYGSHSKWSNRPGHDLTFVAEAGILDETLDRDGAPVLPGVFISDYMSGSYGALAVVAALYQVKETGAGQHLEISMFESTLSTLSVLGTVDMRLGLEELHSRYPENLPNHRIYRCKDKRFLACAPFEPQFWQIFLHKIERTDLTKYDVIEDKVILIEEVSKTIAQKTFKEWMAIFNEPPDCCVSPVNTVDEALDFLPEGRSRVVTAIEHDKIGTIHQIKSPLYQLFAKRDKDVFYTDTDACLDEVLKTLDYSQSDIEKIKQEQVSKYMDTEITKNSAVQAIINAGELVTAHSAGPKTTAALSDLGIIKNGAVVYQDGVIIDLGTTSEMLAKHKPVSTIDAAGQVVMPGFVDPHTHLVHMGSRHEEYECKIAGKSYADLHKVGGIRYTVGMTRQASADDLYDKAYHDLDIMLLHGTTTAEAKSGYGLDRANELKLLQVAKRLSDNHPIDLVSTFLGAHTVPEEYKDDKAGYVSLVRQMLAEAAPLAEFCDVWCDALGFSVEQCKEILDDARAHGMKLKLHIEQTSNFGGAALAGQCKAISADHLDFLSTEGIQAMRQGGVIGILLPGVTFHLMEFKKDIPVKEMIDSGMAVALATDYNPGTCRTQSMQAILDCACRLYRMTYAQAINAATINAAYALDRGNTVGSLAPGKKADMAIFDCTEHGIIINNFGVNHVHTVIKDGNVVVRDRQLCYQ